MAHAKVLLDYMHSLWKNGALTDTVICCRGSCIAAHAVILSAYSRAFAAVLNPHQRTDRGTDSRSVMVDISDTGLDLDCLWRVLEYLYTGQISTLGSESLASLSKAARRLHIPSLASLLYVNLDPQEDVSNRVKLVSNSANQQPIGKNGSQDKSVNKAPKIIGRIINIDDTSSCAVASERVQEVSGADDLGHLSVLPNDLKVEAQFQQYPEESSALKNIENIVLTSADKLNIIGTVSQVATGGSGKPVEDVAIKPEATFIQVQPCKPTTKGRGRPKKYPLKNQAEVIHKYGRHTAEKNSVMGFQLTTGASSGVMSTNAQPPRRTGRPRKFPLKLSDQLLRRAQIAVLKKRGRPRKHVTKGTNEGSSQISNTSSVGTSKIARPRKYQSEARKLSCQAGIGQPVILLEDIAKQIIPPVSESDQPSPGVEDDDKSLIESSCTARVSYEEQHPSTSSPNTFVSHDSQNYESDDIMNDFSDVTDDVIPNKEHSSKKSHVRAEENDPEWSPFGSKTLKISLNKEEDADDDNRVKKRQIRDRRKKYRCTSCSELIKGKQALREHEREVHGLTGNETEHSESPAKKGIKDRRKTYQCPSCNQLIRGKREMKEHRRETHGFTGAKLKHYECPECDEEIIGKQAMMKHRKRFHGVTKRAKTHKRRKQRVVRELKDDVNSLYANHQDDTSLPQRSTEVLSDLGERERPHLCFMCKKRFVTHDQLTAHIDSDCR